MKHLPWGAGPARERARRALASTAWPAPVLAWCARLAADGARAWIVGRSVRDALRAAPGREPWRLAAPLPAAALAARLGSAVVVGAGDRRLRVLEQGTLVEIEAGVADPGGDPLDRHDFTVNALGWDPLAGELSDAWDGARDLERRRLRWVGDGADRLAEDALRALRLARLAAEFEWRVDDEARAPLAGARDRFAALPAARVRDELDRLLATPRPSEGFEILREANLLDVWLPELAAGRGVPQNRFHAYDVYFHGLYSCDAAPAERRLVRWAALLHDVGKPEVRAERDGDGTFHGHEQVGAERADQLLRRLAFAPADREHIVHLVREHMFGFRADASDAAVRRWLARVGVDRVADLFDLRIADTMGNGARAGSPAQLDAFRDRIERLLAREEGPAGVALAVNGDDVLAITGGEPGPAVGAMLRTLRAEVAERPELNTREHLLARIRAHGNPRDERGTP